MQASAVGCGPGNPHRRHVPAGISSSESGAAPLGTLREVVITCFVCWSMPVLSCFKAPPGPRVVANHHPGPCDATCAGRRPSYMGPDARPAGC